MPHNSLCISPPSSPLLPPEVTLSEFALPAVLPDDIPALKALLWAQQAAHEAGVKAAVSAAVKAVSDSIKREAQEKPCSG